MEEHARSAAARPHRPGREVVIGVFVLVVATLAVAAPGQTPAVFRVMTWNIAAGNGDLRRIAEVIRGAAPDVAALQEVDVRWSARSAFEDQAARLGELTGMEVRFGPIYELAGDPGAPRREFGLAVLSRRPIAEFTNHVIPRLSTQSADPEPRPLPGFPEAVVDVAGTRIHVFNTHLDYRADPRVRMLQVTAMLGRLDAVSEPVVLMGDLNAPPTAVELAPLFRSFKDAWTAEVGAGFTYPARAPVRRIDYVLTRGNFVVRDVRTVTTDASDHLPVVADLVTR
jgi:endonuclease/exonuclease/phosphatase family metal-dependent hydrolase